MTVIRYELSPFRVSRKTNKSITPWDWRCTFGFTRHSGVAYTLEDAKAAIIDQVFAARTINDDFKGEVSGGKKWFCLDVYVTHSGRPYAFRWRNMNKVRKKKRNEIEEAFALRKNTGADAYGFLGDLWHVSRSAAKQEAHRLGWE